MSDDPWKTISRGEMRRVNENGRFNYFWGVSGTGQSALILMLPAGLKAPDNIPKLRNLEMRFSTLPQPAFITVLKDASHRNIFGTLCKDIITAGEIAKTPEEALVSSLARARRWHYLLKAGDKKGLTLEEQRGLIGELACLRTLTAAFGPAAAAEAWRGPEGASRDFELPNLVIEVKAKREGARPFVRISSEEQLTELKDGRVILRVYDIQNAIQSEGLDLHDHVNQTLVLFKHDVLASQRIEILLNEIGYDLEENYGDRRWIIGKCRSFNVLDGFPRITPPLVMGVSNVKYDIALENCQPFLCTNDPLESLSVSHD